MESYVKGVVGAFANDPRILAWDVWNEPDNHGGDDSTRPGNQRTRPKSFLDFFRRLLPGLGPHIPRSP